MAFFLYIAMVLVAAGCHAQSAPKAPGVGAPAPTRSAVCKAKNGYYKVDASCDSYVECRDYMARDLLCPEGLHYNPDAKWPNYPCGYPSDVPCTGRGAVQKAKPTADCPHQYGYFPSPIASDNCGQYRMCVAGKAYEMSCPTGLAFNPATSRCDWPDLVPSCKVDKFLGFSCPPAPLDINGQPIADVLNYKYEGNCYYFFACEQGRARLLSCDEGLAFDPVARRCVDADLVQCDQKASA